MCFVCFGFSAPPPPLKRPIQKQSRRVYLHSHRDPNPRLLRERHRRRSPSDVRLYLALLLHDDDVFSSSP
ncbi:hypothetical protein OPV22_002311 [Ensete ventricosum]|uniref:Uncharacterized protein n=1 Tax=Ensete ventricosum TaxID=4639 RepID=A0AAV8RXK2_ENSVE|nr:hypothetical protein OPV22_002311 [Ensete ventricosum]